MIHNDLTESLEPAEACARGTHSAVRGSRWPKIRNAGALPEPGDAACDGNDLEQLELLSRVDDGYVRARFGDEDVLITPELADEVRIFRGRKAGAVMDTEGFRSALRAVRGDDRWCTPSLIAYDPPDMRLDDLSVSYSCFGSVYEYSSCFGALERLVARARKTDRAWLFVDKGDSPHRADARNDALSAGAWPVKTITFPGRRLSLSGRRVQAASAGGDGR